MRAAVFLGVCLLSVSLATATDYQGEFDAWKAKHVKAYASADEESMRFAIFKANLDRVNAHNAKNLSWTMGMNQFGDLTPNEFGMGHKGGYKPQALRGKRAPAEVKPLSALPESVDWVAKGAVTSAPNEGQCGACWAFSAVSAVESINKINGGKLYVLSTQEIVDCDQNDDGCNGGFMDGAFEAVISLGGLCTAEAYPYTGQQGTCRSHDCTPVVKINGYKDVAKNSDVALATAVAQQPVAIGMEADQSVFQFYSSGVLTGQCGSNIDHSLLAVGYGELNKVPYYKMQNVWGTSWGMNGYVLIARGESYNSGAGECGIYMQASYPTQ